MLRLAAMTLSLLLPLAAQRPDQTPPAPAPAPVATTPAVGQPAPTFRLNDHTGAMTTVGGANDAGTWTVLAFYPKAATPG